MRRCRCPHRSRRSKRSIAGCRGHQRATSPSSCSGDGWARRCRTRGDGTPYLSSAVQFEDARSARKETWVYRRTAKVLIDADDPDFEEKRQQKRFVDQFFERFKNPDGTLSGGFHPYDTVDDFRRQFEAHLKAWVGTLVPA